MTTIAQEINARHLQGEGKKHRQARGAGGRIVEEVGLFLAAPVIGLGYALFYGIVGLAMIFCYGLKAFGVRCGLFAD